MREGDEVIRTLADVVDEARTKHILKVLEQCAWHVTTAALHLGLSRISVYRYVKQHNISIPAQACIKRLCAECGSTKGLRWYGRCEATRRCSRCWHRAWNRKFGKKKTKTYDMWGE